MPLKQSNKIKALGNVVKENKNFKQAALFAIDDKGTILYNHVGRFLLNPSTYDDSKTVNWAQQNIPGQSDPVLQWVSSGARIVTFDALVTADTSYFDSGIISKPGEETDQLKKSLTAVSDIASAFFKISVPPPRQTLVQTANNGDKLDISNFLNYYRSLAYPTYDDINNPKKLRFSPPLLVLFNGSTTSKLLYSDRISTQHDLWVLSDLKIKVTKQLPNLAPMEAVVSFTLIQYNIKSFDTRRFGA